MSNTQICNIRKSIFDVLTRIVAILAFLPMLNIEGKNISIVNILDNQDFLMEFGNYKSTLPLYLYVTFFVSVLFFLVSVIFSNINREEISFILVSLGFLGNLAFLVYLLPPLIPEHTSCFTGFLYCYIGFSLVLLVYSCCCLLQSDFISKLKYLYIDSIKHLYVTRNLVVCGMMAALAIVLNLASVQLPLFQVGVSGLPNRIVDFLFGPTVGMIFAGIVDAIECFTKGYQFSIGYNIQAILGGLIYGTFYYNLQIKKPHNATAWSWIKVNLHSFILIFIAQAIVKIFLNIGFGTYLYSIYYGKAFWAILPGRTLKNLIQIPLDTVVHFFLLVIFQQLRRYIFPENKPQNRKNKASKKNTK